MRMSSESQRSSDPKRSIDDCIRDLENQKDKLRETLAQFRESQEEAQQQFQQCKQQLDGMLSRVFLGPFNAEVIALGTYHPKWFKKGRNPLQNFDFDGYSQSILDVKDGLETAVNSFYERLEPLLGFGFCVSVVPSHVPRKCTSGVYKLARKLASTKGRLDCTSLLERTTLIQELHSGGPRNIEVHLESIIVTCPDIISGKNVLLLDDIITTGNSMQACRQLLLESGAAMVQSIALGKTQPIKRRKY
jgi:hypothetical protein